MAKLARFIFFLVLILSLFPLYTRYKESAGPIPPGVYLGGVEMSRYKDAGAIEEVLAARLQNPVAVHFGDARLALLPEEIDFQIDADAMVAEAGEYLEGQAFVDIAVRQLLGLPQRRRDVPVYYTYDHEALLAWLHRVAVTHNRPPQPARVVPPQWDWTDHSRPDMEDAQMPAGFVGNVQSDWQWSLGSPGQVLNVTQSVEPLLDALGRADNREVHLLVNETPPPPLTMSDLARALDSFTSDFPGFAAVYVQDLSTGEEATVDVDVAFSGMSTMKVAIVTEAFRQMDGATEPSVGQLMDFALGESSNHAANQLLAWTGDGDTRTGGRRVTEMFRALGFENSFVQTGYENSSSIAAIPTEANQRTDWDTNPDPHLQSTASDMGRLLAEIYRCTNGEGKLVDTFDQAVTPEECLYILFYMSHDEFQELIWAGLPRPETSWIVHKHGFVNEAHSDLALVWGPTGPYVLSIYLWRSGWMDWDTSNSTMKEISRIVWSFFERKQALEGIEPDDPPVFEVPPNYEPVNTYSTLAAGNTAQGDAVE